MKIDEALKNLPGINIIAGMQVWEDYEDYYYILQVFSKKRRNSFKVFDSLIKLEKYNEAAELAHAIKSTSGNLYLEETFQCASNLEKKLLSKDKGVSKELRDFSLALSESLNSIAQLPIYKSDDITQVSLNDVQLNTLLNDLYSELSTHIIDDKLLSNLKQLYRLLSISNKGEMNMLKKNISVYNFEGALSVLLLIAKQFQIQLIDKQDV